MAATTKGEDKMPSFKDTEGRVWTLRITVAAIRRIKDIAGIDLGDFSVFGEGGPFSDLGSDSCRLVEIVYAAVKPEADVLGVTMEKFMESFVGETVVKASEALLESLADFFPGSQGLLIRRALELSGKAKEDADAQLRRFVEETLEKASGRR